jgi:hypothetical protein
MVSLCLFEYGALWAYASVFANSLAEDLFTSTGDDDDDDDACSAATACSRVTWFHIERVYTAV